MTTGDGSITIHLPDWDEQYHSKHGALQEALHVFIHTGLDHYVQSHPSENVRILEIGFGTGLNCLLTYQYAKQQPCSISYDGVEAFPISIEEADQLNYAELIGLDKSILKNLHETPWETFCDISEFFKLQKRKRYFDQISDTDEFDLIYFDAFGARVQPELWTEAIFERMFQALVSGGVLVTYAAKGSVRRAMISCGFQVERLPGPPGKREMLRATKP